MTVMGLKRVPREPNPELRQAVDNHSLIEHFHAATVPKRREGLLNRGVKCKQ